MDYILEEMERQRLALERLLTPVRTKRTEERQEEITTLPREWETAAGKARTNRSAAEAWTEIDRLSTDFAALPVRYAALSAMGESYAPAVRGRMADGVAARRIRGQSTSAEATAAQNGRMLVRTEMSGIRQAAQEVSRTVEREARRYDGGFEMY